MNMDTKSTLVYATAGHEYIKVWNRECTYPLGAVIRCLLEADSSFWSNVEVMAQELKSIAKIALANFQESGEFSQATSYYEDAIKIVERFKNHTQNILPLKDLVLAMPIQTRYMYYYRESLRIMFSKPELNNFEHNLLHCDNLLAPEYKELVVTYWGRLGDTAPMESILHIHKNWLKMLDNPSEIKEYLNIFSAYVYPEYCIRAFLMIHAYASDLQSLLIEVQTIKKLAGTAISFIPEEGSFTKEACRNSIAFDTDQPRLMSYNEAKAHYDLNPKNPLYALTSISSFVALELSLFDQYKIIPRYCKICDLPYFSTQPKAKYCHFPNLLHNGSPCFIVAKKLDYTPDDVKKELDTNRNTYGTWVRRCRSASPPSYIHNLKRFILGTPITTKEKKEKSKLWDDILKDLKDTYVAWSERAGNAYEDYQKGLLTKTECLKLIEVPASFSERGTLFGEYYKKMKDAENP